MPNKPVVFISYSHKDEQEKDALLNHLSVLDAKFTIWSDDQIAGGDAWELKIEQAISEASMGILLVTANFLNSEFIIKEEVPKLLLRRKNDGMIVYPIIAKACAWKKVDWLAKLNVRPKNGTPIWKADENFVDDRLAIISEEVADLLSTSIVPVDARQPKFQNREEELDEILSNLRKPVGGVCFWQILAPPQLGKSWFLSKLAVDLNKFEQGTKTWEVRRVNIKKEDNSLNLRSNIGTLLTQFFGVSIGEPVSNADVKNIARLIVTSKRYWLLLLDDAHLLSDEVAVLLRNILSDVDHQIRNHNEARIAFVASSRRHFNYWGRQLPGFPRFNKRLLTPFTENVISITLRHMLDRDSVIIGNNDLAETAQSLYQITEGLPALLILYLGWIQENEYIFDKKELEEKELFGLLTKPYIEEKIISADSLLPAENDANQIKPKYDVLGAALKELCSYRRFIMRYLDDWLSNEDNIKSSMPALKWSISDLHGALKRTYIMEPTSNDLWTVFYPAVRRLLFRYFYGTRSQQEEAHKRARKFYLAHWQEWDGTDRAIIIVEYLWHTSECLKLKKAGATEKLIIDFAREIFNDSVKSNLYSIQEIREIIMSRMGDDEEFQNSIYRIGPEVSKKLMLILKAPGEES